MDRRHFLLRSPIAKVWWSLVLILLVGVGVYLLSAMPWYALLLMSLFAVLAGVVPTALGAVTQWFMKRPLRELGSSVLAGLMVAAQWFGSGRMPLEIGDGRPVWLSAVVSVGFYAVLVMGGASAVRGRRGAVA